MNISEHKVPQAANILAFDTSGDEASVALWANGQLRQAVLPPGSGSHSQAALLLPTMQELLATSPLTFQDLDIIATPRGPGSFTGIRVGLATAHGLLLSTPAKIFAPTTFQAFAFGDWQEQQGGLSPFSPPPCLVTLPTKRDSFYTQLFDQGIIPSEPPTLQTEAAIQNFLSLNPTIRRIHHLSTPTAETLIRLYWHGLESQEGWFVKAQEDLRPYYVHDPEFVKQKLCSL